MNLGEAQVSALLAIHLFDDYFKALYDVDAIPSASASDVDTDFGKLNATTLLDRPDFELAEDANGRYTRLHLTGNVELRPEGETEGDPIVVAPLNTWVRLGPVIKPRDSRAPIVGFVYGGVDVPPAWPITPAHIDDVFEEEEMRTLIENMELDLFEPLIEALEENLFPDDDPPDPDEWPTALRFFLAGGERPAAFAALVALPGEDPANGEDATYLDARTEFAIIYSRQMLDQVLANAAAEQEGEEVSGAEITTLSLSMTNDAIAVDGRAEQDLATITFVGSMSLSLVRGTTTFHIDTSDIEVDVELPWWADLFLFLAGPGGILSLGIVPIIGSVVLSAQGSSLAQIEGQIASAPTLVRGGIGNAMQSGLAVLAEGLLLNNDVGTVTTASTPDHSVVEDGHIAVYAQLFVLPTSSTLTSAIYNHWLGRFVEYELANGRRFSAPELARIVKLGKIDCPGYHAVERPLGDRIIRYMRANPDGSENNNLLAEFANIFE